jgi:tetratricopeptide (TPR) repeat protein
MIRNNIGMTWLGLRDFHQAERQLRLALNQLEAVAPGRPDSAKVLLNLVTALRNRKHFGQAEEASTRATAILESAFGENHPIVALALNSRAEILLQTSRCQESAALLERALITWESAYGREDPFTATLLNNLGTARACLGDDASAERWLALALQVRERVLPPGHPYIALTLSNYAHVLGKLGRNKESGQFRKRADGLRVEHDSSNLIGRAIALRDWTSLRRGW